MKQTKKITLIAVVTAAILILPFLLPNAYIIQIVNMIGIYAIVGTGVNILTGYTGQLSLGQAAFYGIGAYTTALLNTKLGCPFFVVLPASVLVTAVFGVFLAIPALKVRGSYLALLCKQELVLSVVGGLFVAETLSVILQVGYFRWTGGKRIFRMAPLHHHFELKGVPESKIIIRFWITSILLGLVALSVLKLR